MTAVRVDLQSDTVSRPTPAMRRAMAEAEVGDEQRGEDPTVERLCRMVAELLAKEEAIFLPSGTMCNQIAVLVHCRPGDEVLADRRCHIVTSECGGAAALAGATVRPLSGSRGVFTADDVRAGVREPRRHAPVSRMVAVEQTVNYGGGAVWPLASIEAVARAAREHGLVVHMDGARLMNAVVARNVSARDFARPCDTVWIDLSKGLGCPIGGVLAGSAEFIEAAWPWKQRLGGSMRQAGIIAAAGVYALEHHVERLADGHAHAKVLAERIAAIPGITLDPEIVETNMVFFDVSGTGLDAAEVHARLLEHGVRIGRSSRTRMRAVTHIDVDRDGVIAAADALERVIVN